MYNFSHGIFSVNIYQTISGIENKWDAVLPADHHLKSGQLFVLESAKPSDISFRYLMVETQGEVVAVIYFQLLQFGSSNYNLPSPNIFLRLLKPVLGFKCIKLLICGNLLRVEFPCTFYLEDKIELKQLLEIIERVIHKENPSAFLIKDATFSKGDENLIFRLGYKKFVSDMTMKLSIRKEWISFDDYVKDLSHKYRQRAKKVRGKRNPELRELSFDEIESSLNTLGNLLDQCAGKQVIRMGIIEQQYFIEMKKDLKDKFRVFGYFFNGQMIAFSSHIEYKDTLEVHYIGIDYEYNNQFNLYFNILFDGVERTILLKKKYLELGRTAREAKAIVGCKPVYFNDYMKINNFFIHVLLDTLQKYFLKKQGEDWMKRNPFKENISL